MPVDGIKLAVGQVWRLRDGTSASIRSNDRHRVYPWNLTNSRCVTSDGQVFEGPGEDAKDLVELLRDEHGFTPWAGGPRPVAAEDPVVVRWRNGQQHESRGSLCRWTHNEDDYNPANDIVAYKVMAEPGAVVDAEVPKSEPLTIGIDPGAPEGDKTVIMTFGKTTPPPPPVNAIAVLEAAAGHMRDRAATYDKPEGERSMAQTVAAFNAITNRDLTEAEGWLVLDLLKLTRLFARAGFHRDSAEDHVAYAALLAEAKAKEVSSQT